MIIAEIAVDFDERILSTLAWVFTFISGAVSIILSINRFGLTPGRRNIIIAGLLSFGLIVVALYVADIFPFSRFVFVTREQAAQIRAAHEKDGNHSSGYTVTQTGVTEQPAGGQVNRVSDFIYAVKQPNDTIIAVYNGSYFDADVNGKKVNCELIDIGDGRVLVIIDGRMETNLLSTDQANNTFKIQKVPVSKPRQV